MHRFMYLLLFSGTLFCGCKLIGNRGCCDVKAPLDLQVENLTDPIGVDAARPRFSWKLLANGDRRNVRQHSYRIIVADSKDRLASGEGNLWDSGRVVSEAQFGVAYAGRELRSSSHYYWRVQVWTGADEPASSWSGIARWVTGIMKPADWRAEWIGPNRVTRPDYDLKGAEWIWDGSAGSLAEAEAGNSFYYASFNAPEDVADRTMVMALTADDEYEVHINGQLAAKCWGHFNEWKWMRFISVSHCLKPGANMIAVRVRNKEKGPTGLLLVIRDDGDAILRTDASWKAIRNNGKEWFKPEAAGSSGLKPVSLAGSVGCEPWGAIIRRFEIASPAFEKKFTVAPKPVERAILHITAPGFYEASLNGRRIGSKVLDPVPTRYDRSVLYSTYDLSDTLASGENTMNVLLGHGWYDMRSVSVWNFDNAPWRDFPRMIAQLEVYYEDGTRQVIVSDESWRHIKSPIGYDCIREGMVIGKSHPEAPDFDVEKIMAEVVPAPAGRLTASSLPPTKVIETLKPVSVTKLGENRWMVDFGQNMAGWVDLRVAGQDKGDRITLLYGERLNKDGSLHNKTISAHFRYPASTALVKDGFFQKDHIFCDGTDGWIEYPHFVYHGFQYVEIEGLKRKPDADSIVASVVCTGFKSCGSFICSNQLLNALQRAALWAYKGNFANGYPTDCPHREKNGWTGDASLASEMGMLNFDNTAAYEKWVQDIMDEQRPDGNVAAIIPTSGWGYQWGNGPAWDSALLIVPWMLYTYKGDLQILKRSYDSMKLYVDYMTSRSKDHLVTHGLGDWIPANSKVPAEVTSSGYYYLDAMIVARTAELLGRKEDARNYAALADRIKAAFNRKYYQGNGIYSIGSQTALSCALHQGVADTDKIVPARNALVELVANKDRCVPDFGILGSKYIFRALSDAGRTDLAYTMLNQTERPSFGKWLVKDGATTLWEDWDEGSSRNHIMFGDFSAWMYQYLAGIRLSDDVCTVAQRIDPAKVAFKEFVIAPDPVEGLDYCHAGHDSPYGAIVSKWSVIGGDFNLHIEVPVNTTATVYLPVKPGTPGVKSPVPEVESSRDRAAFKVGSGHYFFFIPDFR